MELKLGSPEGPTNFENWVKIAKSISDVLIAFAWPIALIVIALAFKKEISALLGRLQSADVAGTKVEFGDKIDTLQRQIPNIAEKVLDKIQDNEAYTGSDVEERPDDVVTEGYVDEVTVNGTVDVESETGLPSKREIDELRRIVENISEQIEYSGNIYKMNPRERIISAWSKLEVSLNKLFVVKFPTNLSTGVENRLARLADRGIIPLTMFDSIKQLNSLRNEVAHNANLSIGATDASEFVRTATQMGQMLELLASSTVPQRQR
ncbi:hypothetical protein [Caulobacter sp. Root1472]|uniref:hypothetical protein n=1 Tax=Caulobacter sp. Root1472 TaxID=1736470 RepID=UPI000A62EB8A|nr:hypothetical protein [Caulobacter sp. Root1472]